MASVSGLSLGCTLLLAAKLAAASLPFLSDDRPELRFFSFFAGVPEEDPPRLERQVRVLWRKPPPLPPVVVVFAGQVLEREAEMAAGEGLMAGGCAETGIVAEVGVDVPDDEA